MVYRHERHRRPVERHFPAATPERGRPCRPSKDNWTVVNVMLSIAKTGAPWRDLPECYGLLGALSGHAWAGRPSKTSGRAWSTYSQPSRTEKRTTAIPPCTRPTGTRREQKKAGSQAIGRSVGSPSTQLHPLVDASGNPVKLAIRTGTSMTWWPLPPCWPRFVTRTWPWTRATTATPSVRS